MEGGASSNPLRHDLVSDKTATSKPGLTYLYVDPRVQNVLLFCEACLRSISITDIVKRKC